MIKIYLTSFRSSIGLCMYMLKRIMVMLNDMSDAYDMNDVHVCVSLMNVLLCMNEFIVWIYGPWFGLMKYMNMHHNVALLSNYVGRTT